MDSLLAAWRVSLHRSRADWPIVAAAGLIALLAATLLAAGPIYSSAVSVAGLQRTLADAPIAVANVEVVARVKGSDLAAADAAVVGALREAAGATGIDVGAAAVAGSFGLPDQMDGPVRDLVVLGFVQDAEAHVTLVAGTWPTPADPLAPVQVAVLESIAETLGLEVGQQLTLTNRVQGGRPLEVVVTSIYRPIDPSDSFWWASPTMTEGLVESDQYRTFGPLLTTADDLIARGGSESVELTWHGFPRVDNLAIEDMASLRGGVEALGTRIEAELPGTLISASSGLPAILAEADRSLLVSGTGVLILMIQLAVLAGYAIVLTAGLIVDHRRADTALLRSRGANPPQVALLALVEAVLIVLPAGLLAPWLAAAALRLFNIAGPLSGIGLEIEPVVSGDAYFAAGIACFGCAVLLMLPAFLAARSYASERAQRARAETRTLGQRIGLDIALVVVTVLGLWQLRLYGAPLTRTVQGSLGIDPLLVAAPAIGMLAGTVVALRVVPLLAAAAEGVITRGRRLVGSLGIRQLARRPLRYTRASLLIMLAVSMGVFAVSYVATWSQSQRDQADFQVGADLRVTPARGSGAIPPWALDTAYRSIGGVTASTPVERASLRLTPGTPAGELLAVDADVVAPILTLRDDPGSTRLDGLVRPLVGARPTIDPAPIPGRPQRLLLSPVILLDATGSIVPDPGSGENVVEATDPATVIAGSSVIASATIRDARGLLHRYPAEPAPLAGGARQLVIPLMPPTARAREAAEAVGATLAYPVELVDVDLEVRLPPGTVATAGRLALEEMASSDAVEGEDWQSIDLDAGDGWQLGWSQGPGRPIALVPGARVEGRGVVIGEAATGDEGPFDSLPGVDRDGHGVTVSFAASGLTRLAGSTLDVVVNRAFLDAAGAMVGDQVLIPLAGRPQPIRVAGVLEAVPTTDPARPAAIADAASLALVRFASDRRVLPPEEWWLDIDDRAMPDVLRDQSAGPLAGADVVSRSEVRARLSADPIALAMIGALSLGFIVAVVFAVVGLAVTASVSLRQRRTEFALLRALGLSSQELSRSLWLENGSLVVVSLSFGTTLGLFVSWLVLPFVTVTQGAAVPFPPVLVEVPWATIIVLEIVTAAALVVTLVLLGRLARRSGVGSALRMGDEG